MERLTLDTKILFCDIAQCRETPGGSFCADGYCDQRRVYERLREYERLGTIADLTDLVKARDEGRVVELPCKVGDTVYTESHCKGLVKKFAAPDLQWVLERAPLFGKTVFLTRGEAEAALAGGERG